MKALWTLVRDWLRTLLGDAERVDLPPLPCFHGGIPRIDIAYREALEVAMGDERFSQGS